MIRFLQLTGLFLFISITISFAQTHGNASYYSHKLKGRHTSNGGKYHPDSLTCAHRSYPFGTLLKVRNPKNDKQIIVKVTDRGPHRKKFIIDLSFSAAKALDMIRVGVASVEITRLDSLPLFIPTTLYTPIPIISISRTIAPKSLHQYC